MKLFSSCVWCQEREQLSQRLQGLVDENTALEFAQNQLKDGPPGGSRIRRMLSYTSTEFLHGSHLQLSAPAGTSGDMVNLNH